MDLMTIQQIVHSSWVPTIVTPSLSQPQAPSPTEVCSAFPLSGCGLPPHRCITPRMALAVCYIHNILIIYYTNVQLNVAYNFIIFTSLWEIIHDCNRNSTEQVSTATLNYNNKPSIPSINRTGGGQLSIYTCTPSYENFEKSLPQTKYMYTNLDNSMKVVIFMFLFSKSYSLPPPPSSPFPSKFWKSLISKVCT